MPLVLGIDAAWTEAGSSGVALLRYGNDEQRILAASPSYAGFVGLQEGNAIEWVRPPGGAPQVRRLLDAAAAIGQARVDVVAIDMPMALELVEGGRAADREISRAFGAFGAPVYTPGKDRPGRHGFRIVQEFVAAGFRLATNQTAVDTGPALVEVYPHVALLRLCNRAKRLPYKVSRTTRYWPNRSIEDRIRLLLDEWTFIRSRLGDEVKGIEDELPPPDPATATKLVALKPYEDGLDATVCAWVGLRFAQGRAEPFGDHSAAIWVPMAPENA